MKDFISFEIEPKYIEIANNRLDNVVFGDDLTNGKGGSF
jgi:hypothetical protein